jgi:hypothetical protein
MGQKWQHFWATFSEAIFYIFIFVVAKQHLFVGILRFQKWFEVDILDFQIQHFGMCFVGQLFTKSGHFFPIFWSLMFVQ